MIVVKFITVTARKNVPSDAKEEKVVINLEMLHYVRLEPASNGLYMIGVGENYWKVSKDELNRILAAIKDYMV